MTDKDKNSFKVKATLKQTTDKIKNSEATEKAIHTVSDLADKTKTTFFDTAEKIKNSETYDKAKSTVNNVAEKVSNTEVGEKAQEFVDSVKNKNIKMNRIIKIGAIGLIAIIIFSFVFSSFGLNDNEAISAMENYLYTVNRDSLDEEKNISNLKIKTIDSYKAKTKSNNDSAKVFILDVKYTEDGIDYQKVCGVYQIEGKEFVCSLQADYSKQNEDSYKNRRDAKNAIEDNLDKIFK